MKIPMSRFQVHDELTAPEGVRCRSCAAPLGRGGQLPNFLAVLAGAPAALRAYARFRSELRNGTPRPADHRAHRARRRTGTTAPSRTSRCTRGRPPRRPAARRRSRSPASGTRATSARPTSCATCARSSTTERPRRCTSTRTSREAGWTDEQLLEAISVVALEQLTALVTVAGDVPVDGSSSSPAHCAPPDPAGHQHPTGGPKTIL